MQTPTLHNGKVLSCNVQNQIFHYGDKSKTEYFRPLQPELHCREVLWLVCRRWEVAAAFPLSDQPSLSLSTITFFINTLLTEHNIAYTTYILFSPNQHLLHQHTVKYQHYQKKIIIRNTINQLLFSTPDTLSITFFTNTLS